MLLFVLLLDVLIVNCLLLNLLLLNFMLLNVLRLDFVLLSLLLLNLIRLKFLLLHVLLFLSLCLINLLRATLGKSICLIPFVFLVTCLIHPMLTFSNRHRMSFLKFNVLRCFKAHRHELCSLYFGVYITFYKSS